MTRFDEPYKTACFWKVNETSKDGHVYDLGLCKFVQYFHVFPTIYLRRCKGPAVPESDLQNMDGEKIDWQHILSNHDDACHQLFRIFPSGKVFSALFTGVLNTIACVCRRGVSGGFPAGLRLAFVSSVRDSLGGGSVSPFFTGG